MDLHTPGDKTFGFGKLYKVRDAYASMVNESYQNDMRKSAFNYVVESIKANDVKRIKKFATKNHKLADIAMTNAINRALTSMKKAFKGMTMTDSMKKSFIKKVRVAINAEIEPAVRLGKTQTKTVPAKMKPRKIMTIKESEEDIEDRLEAKEFGSDEDIETSEDREFKASNFKLCYFNDIGDLEKKNILGSNTYTFTSPQELRDKMEETLQEHGEDVKFYVTDDNSEISTPGVFDNFHNEYEGDTPRLRSLRKNSTPTEEKDCLFVLGYTKAEDTVDDDGYENEGEVYFIKARVEAGYGTELDHEEFKELTNVSLEDIPSSITGKEPTDDTEDETIEDEPVEGEDIEDETSDDEDVELLESDEDLLDAFDNGDLDDQLSLDTQPVDESKTCEKCKKPFKKIRNH